PGASAGPRRWHCPRRALTAPVSTSPALTSRHRPGLGIHPDPTKRVSQVPLWVVISHSMWGTHSSMPVSPVAPVAEWTRRRSGVRRVLACLGGGLCVAALAFLMQLALAHPAGAATPPVSGLLSTAGTVVSSSPVPAAASPVAQTVGT